MLNAQIAELEQAFREQWDGYRPDQYPRYLEQVASDDRTALLARFLAAELEYVYQPPNRTDYHASSSVATSAEAEDDDVIKPNVILLLHRFPEILRNRELAVQLIMLEFALRLRFDTETPHYDSYLQICPDQKDRLGAMMTLLENKLHRAGAVATAPANHDDTTISEEPATHKISLAQLPYCLSYFLLTDVIGQGGMGTVYNAIDLRSAAHVAVKVISGADSWSIYRFIEEFTWLSKLNHPNLVRLYDIFSEGDLRFFSMEVVEGQSIREWFAAHSRQDRWERLRQVLSQAALAIAFLHEQQVIHRDIKSSNLMISREGRAVLLDLGLAMRAEPQQRTASQLDGPGLVGTLYSLAPEVLNGATPTFASDWYSFGVMIFETITGDFPVVKVQLTAASGSAERYSLDRAALATGLEGSPADLASLCVDLLSTLPGERPTAREILERLGSQTGQPIPLMLSDSDFVGRADVLAWLDSGLEAVGQGKPMLRLLRGDSGLGKSTVVQRWLRTSAADPATLCLNLRCHSQDHTPLRALNLLVQELVNCLVQQPPDLWLDLAHGGGEEIVFTFPQIERLGHVVWPKPVRLADSMEGVARRAVGLHALMGWLKSLSQRVRIIISIDDAQWADSESGRILARLLHNDEEFRGLLIVIDQGGKVSSPLVQSLIDSDLPLVNSDCIYELPPLTRHECEQLLAVWTQRLQTPCRAEVTAHIIDRSKGSPFLLQELLRSYVNYVVRNRLTDELWLIAAKQDRALTSHRFSMLTPAAEKTLQFLAVSPQPLSIHQVQTVSRLAPGILLAELRLLAGQGWIRWNGAALDSEVEISHEQFRAVILEAIPQARLQRRHYRLARMLSLEVPPPWRRIAHHYAEAQQPREAAVCYMEGARAAARRLSYDEALWMLERAFHPLAQRTEAEQRAAMRLRAGCLAGQGNAMAAAKVYTALAQDGTEDLQLIRCLAGEQWIRAGRLDHGLENLKSALEEIKVQRRPWWSMTFRPKRPERQTGSEFSEVEQCLNRASGPLTFLDDQLGTQLTTRMFHLALKRGSLKDQAIAAMRWALLARQSDSRSSSRALQWLRRAQGLARRSGSPHARALAHGSLFIWKSLQGEFYASLRYARRMERMFEAQIASDTWEMGYLRWLGLTNLWYLGRLRQQCELTRCYRQDASRRTDSMWTYWMHVEAAHLADLIEDNISGGRQSLIKAGRVLDAGAFQSPQILLWLSHLRQQLYEGQAMAVRQELLQTQQDLWKSSFVLSPFHQWLIRCFRIQCDLVCCSLEPTIAAECIRDARREVRHLAKLPQAAFRCYYRAFQLVIDAASGSIPAVSAWQAAIDEAHKVHLGLLENALNWHLSNWHPHAASCDGQSRLRAEGVVNPARLMNLILPLAHDSLRTPSS